MIYYKNGKYHISSLKVNYIDEHEGEVVKFVGQEGKQWWLGFAEMWKDTFEIIDFKEVKPTQEQIDRLEKINALNVREGISFVNEYVMSGDLSEVQLGHPLYPLKMAQDLTNAQKMAMNLQKQLLLGGR